MSAQSTIERLRALQRSLVAAQGAHHPQTSLTGEFRANYDGHIRGLRAGLQVAIDAIDTEVAVIAAGECMAAVYAQPQ